MSEQVAFILRNLPNLLIGFPGQRPGGMALSLLLAICAVGLGFVLGSFISIGSISRWQMLRSAAWLYVEFFIGMPLLVLLLLVYQIIGGRRFGLELTPRGVALITLTLYSSAYQTKILVAGLRSVPMNLIELARIMGSSALQTYCTVQLPYAIRMMLPALVGQAISLFKDTSVVLIIGVADLMMVARIALGSDVVNAPYWVALYLVVGVLYFCIAYIFSKLTRQWETHIEIKDMVHSLANY